MKKLCCLVPLLIMVFAACKSPVKPAVQLTKPKPAFVDSNLFSQPIAVVVIPNIRLIKKIRKQNSEEDYNTIVDDNSYYLSLCNQYLDSVRVHKVVRESKGRVKFKTNGGKIYTIKLDAMFFGVLLFNGTNMPVSADMTDIATEYERYMQP